MRISGAEALRIAVVLGACAAAAWTLSAGARAPQRWAVVIGVNDYAAFASDAPGGDLAGAEGDALDFRDVLQNRWGFESDHMRVLLGASATKEAIRQALTVWAAERVGDEDLLVFFFAGHGSQALDDDGDEADGLDETLCPHDVLREAPSNDIRDDELRSWLATVPAANVVAVVDACHSGTVTRLHSQLRPRRLARPVPAADARARALLPGAEGTEARELGERVVELAATAPEQLALEGPFAAGPDGTPRAGGVFTSYLVRFLWEAPPGATYDALHARLTAVMRAGQLAQEPQASGPTARPVFGGLPGGAPTMRIVARDAARVTLAAAGAGGLPVGSTVVAEGGAVIRVMARAPGRALGRIESGSATVGASARLDSLALPAGELLVDASLAGRELEALLRAEAERSQGIRVISPADGLPHASILADGDTVRVLGRDGRVRGSFPAGPAAQDGVLRLVRREAALLSLAALDDPGGGGSVEVETLGGPHRIGEEIRFRIRTPRAGFLTLLDLGTSGAVTVLYPNPFDELGRIEAGRWVEVPGPGAMLTVEGPAGEGAVRALVTDRPLPLGRAPGTFLSEKDGGALVSAVRSSLAAEGADWVSGLAIYRVR
ncbi:MAG: DUF4384 domain-containing protein [Gemmatimonadetes bacterium]|nr:DUF4384 domain-containing protein [Gemmatimonadota bacterium]